MTNDSQLLLHGGKVFTAAASAPWADALVVQGDRIVAVGPFEDLAARFERSSASRNAVLLLPRPAPSPQPAFALGPAAGADGGTDSLAALLQRGQEDSVTEPTQHALTILFEDLDRRVTSTLSA